MSDIKINRLLGEINYDTAFDIYYQKMLSEGMITEHESKRHLKNEFESIWIHILKNHRKSSNEPIDSFEITKAILRVVNDTMELKKRRAGK